MRPASMDLFASAQRLQARERPFALVTVVRVVAPTSAREGDKAIVTEDGHIEGWIGGGCAQPVVIGAVREALRDGRARMIRIAPASRTVEREVGDIREFGMACHSGGTIELFVDPILPQARLVIVGDSPVAIALASLGSRVGLRVSVVSSRADPDLFPDAMQVVDSDDETVVGEAIAAGALVVVATQGRRDLEGLRASLACRPRCILLVASVRKAAVLRASLVEAGLPPDAVASIVAPAGQSIGARTPEEIALSILATLIAMRRQPHAIDDGTIDDGPSEVAADATLAAAPRAVPAGVASTPTIDRPVGRSCCSSGGAGRTPSIEPVPVERRATEAVDP